MKRIPLLFTTAALTMASLLPAHAAATSSATLGPLTVTLFDLDPLDGIEAAITFSDIYSGYGSYVSATAYDGDPYEYDAQTLWGTLGFDPVAVAAATTMSAASAAVTGPGGASGTTMSASGYTNGTLNTVPNAYQQSSYGAGAYAPYYYYNAFTLSANTLMLVSATSTLSASVTSSFDPALTYGWESASASTQIYVTGPSAGGGGSQYASDGFNISASSTYYEDPGCTYGYCYGPLSASDTRTVAVSFVNATGADLTGTFWAAADVSGYSYAQAIPEPETYAMMLAGLLSLGFIARRRRQA